MNQNITTIPLENLIPEALKLKNQGYRLVQICSTTLKTGGYELNYSFAHEYEFLGLRLIIEQDTEITSITNVYSSAFLYENEMKDLFGIKINFISLDYNGEFYKLDVKTPFKNQ